MNKNGVSWLKTRIIYEDNDLLVCHKPSGLATQTAKIGQQDMVNELKNYLAQNLKYLTQKKSPPYLGILHRLDQPVEGILVFAKVREAAAQLTKQLTDGSLNKQYYAVVCGQPMEDHGRLVDYLVKDAANNMSRAVTSQNPLPEDAKKAILTFQTLRRISTPAPLALLDIHIETGRFHQIRSQLAHAGIPILGDLKYGPEYSGLSKGLGIKDISLCAWKVEFIHPSTKKKMEFQITPAGTGFRDFGFES